MLDISSSKILFADTKFWKKKKIHNENIFYKINNNYIEKFIKNKLFSNDKNKIINSYSKIPGLTSVIIETNKFILCIVDRVSSSSIFYYLYNGELIISNDSSKIFNFLKNKLIFDEKSINETLAAGYVLGNKTLVKNLFRIESGKYLYYDKKNKTLVNDKYFDYYSNQTCKKKSSQCLDELDFISKNVFLDLIEKASDKKILIPLSGGLDSRHVLTSLLKLNYKNIETFSYGAKGNYDAITAKKISNHLGVKWKFFPTGYFDFFNFYKSKSRQNYWDFADDLILVPNLFSFLAINQIKNKNGNSIIVNGNAGDFLTGNHIPQFKNHKELNSNVFLETIIRKHFSHNKSILTKDFLGTLHKDILNKESLNINLKFSYQKFAKHFEHWEWSERQSKRVVNVQKVYEYFNFDWELPLWDHRLINFWIKQPLKNKIGRNLFIKYLQQTDNFDLFSKHKINEVSVWTQKTQFITYVGKILRVLAGNNITDNFYKFCKRYSKYSFMYSSINFKYYFQNYKNFNDPLSFWTIEWLKNKLIY